MPRFFFHLRDRGEHLRDEEGRELPDVETARKAAVMSARSIICEEALLGIIPLDETIEVQDEEGREVLVIPFADTVLIRR